MNCELCKRTVVLSLGALFVEGDDAVVIYHEECFETSSDEAREIVKELHKEES